jgi:general stress protein YciG
MSDSIKRRGFANMDPARQRELASRGGKAVPKQKRTFSRDRDLAAEAGRRGGKAFRAGKKRKLLLRARDEIE